MKDLFFSIILIIKILIHYKILTSFYQLLILILNKQLSHNSKLKNN